MSDVYISTQEAARLEGMKHQSFCRRSQRKTNAYKFRFAPCPGGGRPVREIAVSSLSPAAQQRYREEQAAPVREKIAEERTQGEAPWYVGADPAAFQAEHGAEWDWAEGLLEKILEVQQLPPGKRGAAKEELAAEYGMEVRTLEHKAKTVCTAGDWALKQECGDGLEHGRKWQIMALCRKPREAGTHPRISEELAALIQNVAMDPKLCRNRASNAYIVNAVKRAAESRGIALPPDRALLNYVADWKSRPEIAEALALGANGLRAFKNKKLFKTRRDTKSMRVMEYVMGDEHTFDCWVRYQAANGRVVAIRPVLITWIDIRSRRVLGWRLCEHANTKELQYSLLKLVYEEALSVPRHLHTDNGKDYTSKAMTGKKRRTMWKGAEETDENAVMTGFYKGLGIEAVERSKPYEPWTKGQMERFYNTVNERLSKGISSYTGTLTGSSTAGKVNKDIKGMLKRGELISFGEFEKLVGDGIAEYNRTRHRGLIEAGEQWKTPMEVWEHEEHYIKAPIPREEAIRLTGESSTAAVKNTGIQRNGCRYFDFALHAWIGRKVIVRTDPLSDERIFVYDPRNGGFLCEAEKQHDMSFMADPEEVAAHKRLQNRQIGAARAERDWARTPYEDRLAMERGERVKHRRGGVPGVMLDDKYRGQMPIVEFPMVQEYAAEVQEKRRAEKLEARERYVESGMKVYERIKNLGG